MVNSKYIILWAKTSIQNRNATILKVSNTNYNIPKHMYISMLHSLFETIEV